MSGIRDGNGAALWRLAAGMVNPLKLKSMNQPTPSNLATTAQDQIATLPPSGPQPRLLIVEDNLQLAMLMEMFLVMKGFQVKLAGTARQAYLALDQEDYHLILLDIDLPDGNGFDICRWIRSQPRLARTPVCFCTGRESLETRTVAAELRALVLFKMFTMDELTAKVSEALGSGSAEAAPAKL